MFSRETISTQISFQVSWINLNHLPSTSMANERPIPAPTSEQLEVLTELHVREIRRVEDRDAVFDEVYEILSYFQAHLHSTPIFGRGDAGVPVFRLVEERIGELSAHMARLQDEERQDRAIELIAPGGSGDNTSSLSSPSSQSDNCADKVDELAKRLHCIKQAKKFLDSPVVRKILQMFSSLTSQRKEYTTAVQDAEKSLNAINGIAAFALRKVIAEIQKEADGVLGGGQERPITVADDDPTDAADNNHPDADSAENHCST
ncbi:unnamed protein product [Penicillium discolor]